MLGFNATEPLPASTVLSVVPKTASTHLSLVITILLVGLLPLASPSHCKKLQPDAGVAESMTIVLLRYGPFVGLSTMVPPPGVNAVSE